MGAYNDNCQYYNVFFLNDVDGEVETKKMLVKSENQETAFNDAYKVITSEEYIKSHGEFSWGSYWVKKVY